MYVCSQGSGEGHLLSVEEKVRACQVAADAIGGQVPVHAAGVGLGDTATTLELARRCFDAGVDAVQVLPPRTGAAPPRQDELEHYYRTLLEKLEGPIHLSHNLYLAGYPLTVDLLVRLANDYRHLVGLNWSDPAVPALGDVLEALGARLEIRVGIVGHLSAAKALGAAGVLCFEPNVAPSLAGEVRNQYTPEGFAGLLRLNSLLSRSGNPRSLKAALRLMGLPAGALRSPLLDLNGTELEELKAGLAQLGYLPNDDLIGTQQTDKEHHENRPHS